MVVRRRLRVGVQWSPVVRAMLVMSEGCLPLLTLVDRTHAAHDQHTPVSICSSIASMASAICSTLRSMGFWSTPMGVQCVDRLRTLSKLYMILEQRRVRY